MNDSPAAHIRAARVDEVAAVLALWGRAGASPSPTETAGDLAGLLARDPEALLVAEADRDLVGSLVVGWDGWRGAFYRLAVDPAQRRRGLASALVRTGEERLRALGAQRFHAIVETEEAGAMAFWASAGYELQAARSRFVKHLPTRAAERDGG